MQTFTFISNYINHHQIPFCEEMRRRLGDGFTFIACAPMDAERKAMGWGKGTEALAYVRSYDEDPEGAMALLRDSDVVLMGWTEDVSLTLRITKMRMEAGRPLFRVSERIYREGQWKAISPRGLLAKYEEFTKYRKAPLYLLCAGAYVASDFALIGAFPNKMFRWGYFPPLRTYDGDAVMAQKPVSGEVRVLYAGRFMPLKHPEYVLRSVRALRAEGLPVRLTMIGDGELKESLTEEAKDMGDAVDFPGFLPPDAVRDAMEKADIFVFPSNHLEGWGAVVNEAMNSGCAVLAGTEAGAAPFLIKNGENGVLFNGEEEGDLLNRLRELVTDGVRRQKLGKNAYATIRDLWNAEEGAARLLAFCEEILGEREKKAAPSEGPMSPAPVIRPFLKV